LPDGNCTVSLMLMAIGGLLRAGLVEWITKSTYQAGAGAAKVLELVRQIACITGPSLANPSVNALDRMVTRAQRFPGLPTQEFGARLAASLIPWVDRETPAGQTREEWKGMAEANKIVGLKPPVPVDGICVRVATMRCHSQKLCIKLKKDVPLRDIDEILVNSNPWVRLIPNDQESTTRCLTPAAVSGGLTCQSASQTKTRPRISGSFYGRGPAALGPAEPPRRMLNIIRESERILR
jgi:aspartate-semialdehyde dehydrogenase